MYCSTHSRGTASCYTGLKQPVHPSGPMQRPRDEAKKK